MMAAQGQRGAALLAVVTLIVAMVAVASVHSRRTTQQRLAADDKVRADLVFARDALIDYSVNYPSHYPETGAGPGHFPCPDTDGDGSPELLCGVAPIGFLAVDFITRGGKQISLLPGASDPNEALWYTVSSAFRYNPVPSGKPLSATIVNSETLPELVLDGESGIIALIIAPGPPLAGQERKRNLAERSSRIDDYLEGENADGDRVFRSDQGNDRIVAVRWADLMPLVERRVLDSAARSVAAYVAEHGHMPWLAPVESLLIDGATVCSPCQWQGWLSTARYRSGSNWPPFSRQDCAENAGGGSQPAIDLPVWFVRNYWHRQLWLQVRADDRGGLCPAPGDPVYEGQAVHAVLSTVGRALSSPQHGQPQQRLPLASIVDFLDSGDWTDGDSNYAATGGQAVNDQWAVLP